MLLLIAILGLLCWQANAAAVPPNVTFRFPPCITEPTYLNGDINPDTFQTLYNCIGNITDALNPPSYYQDVPTIETFISFQFNSMMALSELEGTVTVDMFFRIYWIDERMNMP
jgi:hypothetical protein